MDKTALNYANLLGYQETLDLKGQQFNYLSASTFYIELNSVVRKWEPYILQWCTPATSLVNILVGGSLEDFRPNVF